MFVIGKFEHFIIDEWWKKHKGTAPICLCSMEIMNIGTTKVVKFKEIRVEFHFMNLIGRLEKHLEGGDNVYLIFFLE